MVRHRRSELALTLPRRLAETWPVRPSEEEAQLYREVAGRIRAEGRSAGAGSSMALRTALRLAGSSARAVAPTLERMGWADLAQGARAVGGCTKTAALGTLLQRHAESGEKVIVFTSFRVTLEQLAESAASLGIPFTVYHGALDRHSKDAAIAAFEKDVDVLLSTESAGEGRNLQFCHAMVNFDLPWNPMQIEQRLGRIHRIGQDHDVVLTNLVARGTIEEHILDVLHTKLNLFELVVGELDMVLGRISEDFVFEGRGVRGPRCERRRRRSRRPPRPDRGGSRPGPCTVPRQPPVDRRARRCARGRRSRCGRGWWPVREHRVMVGGRNGAGLGVEFLARYAESEGGLVELGPDGGLLVLPEHLRTDSVGA